MGITKRHYKGKEDYQLISDFLIEIYQADEQGRYANWLQPRWEYMFSLPGINEEDLDKIGIWEDHGRIVAVVTYEEDLGEAFFNVHPDYTHLKKEMFDYAEKYLSSMKEDGTRELCVHINDFDDALNAIAKDYGYQTDGPKPYNIISKFDVSKELPEITVPEGYTLKSLKEDNDLFKIDRCLWRGFNHEGEAASTEKDIEGRKQMQSGSHFKHELNIVVEAPDGEFVTYSGVWYVPENKVGYIEPVATNPDYRRKGLGKAAVLECVKRCFDLGAEVVYVESSIPFYLSIGFESIFARTPWSKKF